MASSAAAAVCDSVAVLWRATGRASVRVIDTTATHIYTGWDEQQNKGIFSDIQGCATVADAPRGLDSASYAALTGGCGTPKDVAGRTCVSWMRTGPTADPGSCGGATSAA